jgi:hypothetical protein
MSDATALTVRLFLASIAMTTFALGVNQAGWRHKTLIVSLFTIAAASLSAAIFFPSMITAWPHLTSSLANIGSDARTWFGLVAFLALYVLVWPIRTKPNQPMASISMPSASAPVPVATPSIAQDAPKPRIVAEVTPEYLIGLHAGRMHAEASRLIAPYLNKWMRVSVSVEDLSEMNGAYAVVSRIGGDKSLNLLFMYFTTAWSERLSVLKQGDHITVFGRIQEVESIRMMLRECELVR